VAKRKTTAKKKTKKASSKKAPKRASSARKKAASKKPAPKKKAPAKKKAASKKKPTKKVAKKPAAKKTSKKSPSKKKAASKKAPAKKKAASKKATSKKPSARKTTRKKAPAKTSKKTKSKKSPVKESAGESKRKSAAKPGGDAAQLKAARDAASRLAALAGLPSVSTNTLVAPEAEKKKRRLTKSPLSPAALKQFRELLLEKRREVAGDVSAIEGEALNPSRSGSLSSLPQHMADQGSDEFEQTLSLGIAASQRRLLIEIDAALDRIDAGVYGICELTGRAIQKARLEATPWCRYSLEGARMADRGLGR